MAEQLQGVNTLVRLETIPDERCVILWVKTASQKFSTSEFRTLARHMLEQADNTDTEANRKKRFLESLPPLKPAEPPVPTVSDVRLALEVLKGKIR